MWEIEYIDTSIRRVEFSKDKSSKILIPYDSISEGIVLDSLAYTRVPPEERIDIMDAVDRYNSRIDKKTMVFIPY